MQGTEQDINSAITTFVEKVLLERIRIIYEEVDTSASEKREQRSKCTREFIEECKMKLSASEEQIRSAVDKVIARTKWINEIEELDEEELE